MKDQGSGRRAGGRRSGRSATPSRSSRPARKARVPRPRPTAPARRRPAGTARSPEQEDGQPPASAAPIEPPPPSKPPVPHVPIVGIGASAGGLEALELFLAHVPERCGMGFVIVQHLDPHYKGVMVELLQRTTSMPVMQVKDRTAVEPDHVYVIPPNRDLSILHGVLHLQPQATPRGLLPIDFFFRSLADDQLDRSIGVILSGMGSDGTLGLRAIKEKAGAAFVQSHASAKFDSMPRSAIDAGLADVEAAAEELPARILAFIHHRPGLAALETPFDERQPGALDKIFILLRGHTGNDFSLYKRSTLCRRIERRMALHQIDKLQGYVRFLRENPRELDLLFKELLIGVTSFFRDPAAWELLRERLLPELLSARAEARVLRAWVPGCSTGEEAYSLAMVLKEAIAKRRSGTSMAIQVFATDLDADAIDRARVGLYPASITADVSPERLRRFFVQDDRGYRVSKEIREAVVFAPQNMAMDPPFTKLDILSCRNLLIYLAPELQRKLMPLFHYSLSPGGLLFLGSAETVGAFTSHFRAIDGKARIYRKIDAVPGALPFEFPSSFAASPAALAKGALAGEVAVPPRASLPNLQALADRVIVQRFAPATVLTTDKGDLLYIGGRTGKYLEPAAGRANLNVFAMAREGLRHELSAAFASALCTERPVTVRGVRIGTDDASPVLDLTVQRLPEPKELRGAVMIVFHDVTPAPAPPGSARTRRATKGHRAEALERELVRAREDLQTSREEMQTSQEELRSTNEELQSTNEEMQSSNEELTTSKEEMQSMNEELTTVNHELQAKVDELSRSGSDMKNLLNSTDIATLFLDDALHVRRFTTQTSRLIKLIPADTGRPITDIATEIDYPELADDAREVLRSLVFREKEVVARDARWFNVRILPYRTLDNVIDGVVITFSDVTATKLLEQSLQAQTGELRRMTDGLPCLVWSCRADGACEYLNRRWLEYTGVPEAEQLGYGWLERVHPDERERVRADWREAVRTRSELEMEHRLRGSDGTYRWFLSRLVPINDERGAVARWYGTSFDVDRLKCSGGPHEGPPVSAGPAAG